MRQKKPTRQASQMANNNKSKSKIQLKQEQLQKQYTNLKKQDQDPWQIIQNLNKLYKVDRILLKHAYDNYPDLPVLKNSSQYKNIQKFYRYTLDNLFKIEKDYLLGEIGGDDQNYSIYQINKNSTSKFLRDQKQHYNKLFKQLADKHGEDDDQAINGTKFYQFIKQCFQTKFTKVLLNGEDYFGDQAHQRQFEEIIRMSHNASNDADQTQLQNIWITYEEILDILTYWLKFNEQKQNELYILYCRTEQKLAKDVAYLKLQAQLKKQKQKKGEKVNQVSHPTTIQKEELEEIQQKITAENPQLSISKDKLQAQDQKQQIKQQKQRMDQKSSILQRYRKNKYEQQIIKNPQKPKIASKSEQLMLKIPQLFVFGCKRRYPLPKGTTFDQIQSESKTMNLQKFINFCNHFEVNKFLSRQLLSQIFKINALNRLVIDQKRFAKIMQAIIATSEKTIDLFLNRKSIQSKLRSQAKLSNYKFLLRPVNGKSIEQLQAQIEQKKIVKSQSKQQKLNLYFIKKQKQKQRRQLKKQKTVLSSRVLPEQTNLYELENMRDDRFDPEKFFGNDQDELLSAYQSKFASAKQDKLGPASLQSILSKRLQKGNKVLQKINSSMLKNYE